MGPYLGLTLINYQSKIVFILTYECVKLEEPCHGDGSRHGDGSGCAVRSVNFPQTSSLSIEARCCPAFVIAVHVVFTLSQCEEYCLEEVMVFWSIYYRREKIFVF